MQQTELQLVTSGLTRCLEELRELAGVGTIRLLRWAEDGPCACADVVLPETAPVQVRVPESGCGRLTGDEAEPLIALPGGETGALLCVRCPCNSGGALALQLGLCPTPGGPYSDLGKLCGLFLPALMWARESLERQALEERLAELGKCSQPDLVRAMRGQEEEREWLAYEVHDRVAQTLASVFQQLQTLEGLARSLPEIRQIAVRASLLTREAIREARNIMNDLHPPVLDELGLAPLVEEELRHLGEDMGCRTRAELPPRVRLPRDVEVALYRILHEALANVRRHSQASEVVVSLRRTPEGVEFRVSDNGVGFDVAAALARKRVGGLMSLHRRAELAGGTCRLESTPGKGTTVSVWISKLANTKGGGS